VPFPHLPWFSNCTPGATGQQSLAYPAPVRLGDIAGIGFPKSDDSGSAPHLAYLPLVTWVFLRLQQPSNRVISVYAGALGQQNFKAAHNKSCHSLPSAAGTPLRGAHAHPRYISLNQGAKMEIDIRKGWLSAVNMVAPLIFLGGLFLYNAIELYSEGLNWIFICLLALLGFLILSYSAYSVYCDIDAPLATTCNGKLELHAPLVPSLLTISLADIERIEKSSRRRLRIYLNKKDCIDVSTIFLSRSKVDILCNAKYNKSCHSQP